jgi:hypothetical protein
VLSVAFNRNFRRCAKCNLTLCCKSVVSALATEIQAIAFKFPSLAYIFKLRPYDVEHYLFVFLKFIASVVPTIEYDYTLAI